MTALVLILLVAFCVLAVEHMQLRKDFDAHVERYAHLCGNFARLDCKLIALEFSEPLVKSTMERLDKERARKHAS